MSKTHAYTNAVGEGSVGKKNINTNASLFGDLL